MISNREITQPTQQELPITNGVVETPLISNGAISQAEGAPATANQGGEEIPAIPTELLQQIETQQEAQQAQTEITTEPVQAEGQGEATTVQPSQIAEIPQTTQVPTSILASLDEPPAVEGIPLLGVTKDAEGNITECGDLFLSEYYESYLVEIEPGFYESMKKISYACAFPISTLMAALSVQKGRLQQLLQEVQEVVYIERSYPYTLSILSPSSVANINQFHENQFFRLTGKGTIIGIVDTGIDYLNEEFMTLDKQSRILELWDQTIESGNSPTGFNFGSVYNQQQINQAIQARREGGDPYTIVPQRDTIGHGTSMAGIAAATGVKIPRGAAPDCEIISVKLKYAKASTLLRSGIVDPMVPVYEAADIALGLRYLIEAQIKYGRPMVILIPLSSNFGGAEGNSALERFIDYYSVRRGIVFITGSGNQGDTGTHSSGVFRKSGEVRSIEVNIDEVETIVHLEFYGNSPDRFGIGIVSPSGEIIERVPIKLKGEEIYNLVFEGSTIRIEYAFPEERTGNEVIHIFIENARGGIWQIRVYGEYIVDGRYDCWLPQRELLKGDTRFINPDAYTTITAPGTAYNIVTTAFYNQGNNSIEPDSGRGFTRDNRVKPEVATGGVDVVTTFLNNETITISGSSAAAAVLAGASSLLLEWGVVQGNDPSMYGPTVAAYFITGATRRAGDIYPNREWGYGTLNLLGTFENLRSNLMNYRTENKMESLECYGELLGKRSREVAENNIRTENLGIGIFTKTPMSIYRRLKVYEENNED